MDIEKADFYVKKEKQKLNNKPSKVGKLNFNFINNKDSKKDSKSDHIKSFDSESQNGGMDSIIIEDYSLKSNIRGE